MNIPDSEPISEYGRAIMDAGKAIETEYVTRYEEDGVLLSRPPTDKYQTGFSDPNYWLSGNLDAVIRPPGWSRGHVVEVKSKDHQVIDEMRSGMRSYDEEHYYQLQVYLGFLQTESFKLYKDYAERIADSYIDPSFYGLTDKIETGSILYVSRDRPRHTKEFVFDYDEDAWIRGTKLLNAWKGDFVSGILTPRDPTWKWLDQPCKWCPVKRICKADNNAGIIRLSDSNAITTATNTRNSYDYIQQRKRVLKRWKAKDLSK